MLVNHTPWPWKKDREFSTYYFTFSLLIKIIEFSSDARTIYTLVNTCPIIT